MPWSINSARNENVEAPGWQGAPSEEYRVYVSEAQRSQPGCIGVLIGQYLWTAVLVRWQGAGVDERLYVGNEPIATNAEVALHDESLAIDQVLGRVSEKGTE